MITNRTLSRLTAAILITFGLAGCETNLDTAKNTTENTSKTTTENTNHYIENWMCKPLAYRQAGSTLTLTGYKVLNVGWIRFDGIKRSTKFKIDGLNRRWDWEVRPDKYAKFSFIIRPDHTGRYYDFGNIRKTASQSGVFECQKQ